MKRTFRQSMTWLHTWAGLLLGWVAYAIFVTGTLSYFRPEITRWMRPELAAATSSFDAARAGLLALAESAPDSRRWIVEVPNERSRELKIYWQPTGGRRLQSELLDPNDGAKAQARGTFGGEFFYRFHFQLLLPHPWGRYTAGVVALAMFVALLTGIVAHRRFFADLFLLRTGRVALRSWLDFHNVAGVLTLPFCLMLCYSALVIFNALYLPWPDKVLPSDQTVRVAPVADAAWVAPAPVEPMLDEALRRWGAERSVRRLDLDGRGTAGATVTLTRDDGQTVSIRSRDQLQFDGVSGVLTNDQPLSVDDGPGRAAHGVLYGLHLGRFAGPMLRGLLFFLGLLGTSLVASGLVMWTLKRRIRLATTNAGGRCGFWLVARLNIAAIAGLLIATGAIFWANRLLPVELGGRAEREVQCFLIAWGAALVHACCRPEKSAWREQLLMAAALFLLLPAVDALTAGRYLAAAGRSRDWVHLGFDVLALVLGGLLAVAAGKVGRRLRGAEPTDGMVPSGAMSPEVAS